MKFILSILITHLLVGSAFAQSDFKPISGYDDIIYKQGYAYAVSIKENSIAVISLLKYDKKIAITCAISNITNHNILIDPSNIQLVYLDEYSGTILSTYIYSKRMAFEN